MQNGTAILEEGLEVSYKAKYNIIQPNYPTPRYIYLSEMKIFVYQKNM